MKYMVGLKSTDKNLLNTIVEHKEHIYEVYFSWGNMPNGRHASSAHEHLTPSQARRCMEEDLQRLSDAGLVFNLLLNGRNKHRRNTAHTFDLTA